MLNRKGKLVLVKLGVLIVVNTRSVQSELECFLDQLRRVKGTIDQKSTGLRDF